MRFFISIYTIYRRGKNELSRSIETSPEFMDIEFLEEEITDVEFLEEEITDVECSGLSDKKSIDLNNSNIDEPMLSEPQ